MYGVFRLKPNDRNIRDLDIEIDVDFQVDKAGIVLATKYVFSLFRGNCVKSPRRTSTRCGEREISFQ